MGGLYPPIKMERPEKEDHVVRVGFWITVSVDLEAEISLVCNQLIMPTSQSSKKSEPWAISLVASPPYVSSHIHTME